MNEKLVKEGLKLLDRIATANEDLIALAREERESLETAPDVPACPHCGALDPEIHSEGGGGQFHEFALVAKCENCKENFAALPLGWHIFKTVEQAAKALTEGREHEHST